MVDRPEFERWRAAAEGARQAAEQQSETALHNWACFLAEQAAQLGMKGLLHGAGAGAWGHDLVLLGDAARAALSEAAPAEVVVALRRLSRHYIPARYPDAHPSGPPGAHYGAEDSSQALADLRVVLDYVDARWRALAGETEKHGS